MDLISHITTGVAVASVVASFRSQQPTKQTIGLLLLGGLAGALPDLDVITMWSGFDSTFGKWFALKETGRQLYFQKHWFSHHGAMHSMFASLLFPFLVILMSSLIKRDSKPFIQRIKSNILEHKLPIITFILAYQCHLFEDMITPGLTWGGVNLFFPLPYYIGGWEKVWWWNNYDLFLILTSIVTINIIWIIIGRFSGLKVFKFALLTLVFGFSLFVHQIETRDRHFTHIKGKTDYHKQDAQSLVIQKEILPECCYKTMKKVDRLIPIAF